MTRHMGLFAAALLVCASGCALSAEGQPAAKAIDASSGEASGASRLTAQQGASRDAVPPGEATASDEADTTSEQTASQPADEKSRWNLKSRTLGGRLFWTDELVYHDWRIQRHADDGHHRLIDGGEKRHAWGTFDECRARLEAIKEEQRLSPLAGKVVLVLHGLGRSRTSTAGMVEFLRANSKFTVLSVGYASTQADVAAHAGALARVIENLGDRVTEINFVAHSLGNIVIRHYLADQTDAKAGRLPDRRIHRIIMVGPPNNGAQMAEFFGQNSMFERVVGESGRAMASQWEDLKKRLAIPQTEFGVIAGGQRDDDGYNPLLPGDDDFVVSVEETKLPGARDFIVVEGLHALLMNNAEVQQAALRFLERGYFVSEEQRQPLR